MTDVAKDCTNAVRILYSRLDTVRSQCLEIAEMCRIDGALSQLLSAHLVHEMELSKAEVTAIIEAKRVLEGQGVSLLDALASAIAGGKGTSSSTALSAGEGGVGSDNGAESGTDSDAVSRVISTEKAVQAGPECTVDGPAAGRETAPKSASEARGPGPAGDGIESPDGMKKSRGPAPPARILDFGDPAATGPFVCYLQNAELGVKYPNPNYSKDAREGIRALRFVMPAEHRNWYPWQHEKIVANGGQLPPGWVLPQGAVLGPDGHVNKV